MATIPQQPMEIAKTMTGGPAFIIALPEAASQSFKPGAVVTFNEAGYIVEGNATNEGRIVGVSQENGSNTATAGLTKVSVAVANADSVFIGNCNSVTAIRDVGRAFRIIKTGNFWLIDKASDVAGASLANRRVICIELDPRDNVGDTNGRMLFTFHPTARALTYTS